MRFECCAEFFARVQDFEPQEPCEQEIGAATVLENSVEVQLQGVARVKVL